MKSERHGRAKILSQSEIQLLFSQGLQTSRDNVSSRVKFESPGITTGDSFSRQEVTQPRALASGRACGWHQFSCVGSRKNSELSSLQNL
jgi:hypothetical protein